MSSTSNVDLAEIDPNQLGKAVTANQAFQSLDAMLGSKLSLAADSLASPYTIPYDSADEPVGLKTALRFFLLEVTGTIAATWTAYMPAGKKKFFLARNSTGGGFSVALKVSGQTGISVPPGTTYFAYLNGTDVELVTACNPFPSATYSYQQPASGATLTASAFLGAYVLDPAASLSSLTVVTPPGAGDGQLFELSTTQTISALTVSPAAGQSVKGGSMMLTANGGAGWRYRAPDSTWYRRF